ncbi:MAG TPA: site-2 protease family protein [Caproiciproducens sp.]|nr:site-2 protease family protein [Caproiciproducens sp.]
MITFTIKSCKITISFLLIAAAAILLLEDTTGIAALTFFAAFLHETGHLMVMRFLHVYPFQVRFTIFGIDIIKSGNTNRSYIRDVLISLAGPAANLTAALPACLLSNPFGFNFTAVNLILAAFNLLPIEPLDGGQALYSLLCVRFSPERSAHVVSVLSFFVLTPLAAIGFLVVFQSLWNFSLLLICCYLMALLVLKKGRYY